MGIESLALDAEGEYAPVAEALGGINVIISPNSKTVINLFDIEIENVKPKEPEPKKTAPHTPGRPATAATPPAP